jgi:hypothetical protein
VAHRLTFLCSPLVSNISRPLEQANNRRPAEATQELIIRVREGLTRKIFEHASGHREEGNEDAGSVWGTDVPIKAWTEGPCASLPLLHFPLINRTLLADILARLLSDSRPPDGHEQYLGEDYATVVLVSGGSGVSYALSNAMDLVRRKRAMHLGHTSPGVAIATERLSFIWMVKTAREHPSSLSISAASGQAADPAFAAHALCLSQTKSSGSAIISAICVALRRQACSTSPFTSPASGRPTSPR